jgi:hypothetical protein
MIDVGGQDRKKRLGQLKRKKEKNRPGQLKRKKERMKERKKKIDLNS